MTRRDKYNQDATCYTDFASMSDPLYLKRALAGNWAADGDDPSERAVGLRTVHYEPGDRFTVQINGPSDFKKQVQHVLETKVFPYVNLAFEIVDRDGACLIDDRWASGGVCMGSGTRNPTLHLSNHTQFLIVHEFGHALGMMHEMRSPSVGLTWVKSALQAKYASGNLDTYRQIMKQFNPDKVVALPFDETSVMGYPLPASSNKQGVEIKPSNEFTALDKKWLRMTYGPTPDNPDGSDD